MPKKRPSADDFLSAPRTELPRVDKRCYCCMHPRAEELNADLKVFAERRSLPIDDSRYTAFPWREYFEGFLRPKYEGLPANEISVRRHASRHLGFDIPL